MLFNSTDFLIFFPIVTLLYFAIPKKIKNVYLLLCSYFFYMCWNARYALLLLGSTIVTYIVGRLIAFIPRENADKQKTLLRKVFVAVGFVLNLSILFFFKYTYFLVDNVNFIFRNLGIEQIRIPFDIVLPVGISFYIFQALGYTVDVYRGEVEAEKNFITYAAFVSFFPQLVAGPIERSKNLLKQFYEDHTFSFERAKNGILLMLFGYFQKVILADRVAAYVDTVFDYPQYYAGLEIVLAVVLFAFQIYCDFAGYSNIARGCAQVLGFGLMNNFEAPYFATSVSDFWRRWHISLTSWFRDYLYFPLGGSRCTKKEHYRNIMIVFLVSGLWHGANWTYLIWGGLNGLYQVLGMVLMPLRKKMSSLLHVHEDAFSHRLLKTVTTFLLIDFTWIFFRADNLHKAIVLIKRMFIINPWILFDGSLLKIGLSGVEFAIAFSSILLLVLVDYMHVRKIEIRKTLQQQDIWFRWCIYLGMIFALLIFGVYGPKFDAAQFIYFQF